MEKQLSEKIFPELTYSELEDRVRKIYLNCYDATPGWGKAKNYYLKRDYPIEYLIPELECKSILDYGCGLSTVVDTLSLKFPLIEFAKYDPFVDEFSQLPTKSYDLILCNHVLQLLNSDLLDHTINNIYQLSNKYVFVVINLKNKETIADKIKHWENIFCKKFEILHEYLEDSHPNAQPYGHTDTLSFFLKKIN